MTEFIFFSSLSTKEVRKKLLWLLYSKNIVYYRRSERQKKYFLSNEKEINTVLGYEYYITTLDENSEKCLQWIKKEFWEIHISKR